MNLTNKQEKQLLKTQWFHATLLRHLDSLKRGIDVKYNLGSELDFGPGFYITSDFEQAQKFINKQVEILNQSITATNIFDSEKEVGIILEFSISNFVEIFKNPKYNCYYFSKHKQIDSELDFAEFVVRNRENPDKLLHNFDFIQNKQIKKWDFVWVQRSWEVIPYIVWVIKERRDGTEDFIRPPLFCPACNWPISNIDIHYYCTNPACPAQIKEKIVHFVSRDAMDIWGIWDSMVEVLVQQGILRSVSDIYALEKIENQILLRKFPNFWEKKIAELAGQLELSKRKPLWRLLNALGIPNVGKKIAQDLAEYLLSKKVQRLSDIPNILWDKEGLSELYGVWGKIIEGLQLYFSNPENLKVLSIFESVGIKPISEEKVMESHWWSHFSLTGSFPMSRGVLIKHLQDKGYQYDENPN